MKTRYSILFLTSFLLFPFSILAQESEQAIFNKAARLYYHGKYNDCRKVLEDGLKIYPNNQKLASLKKELPVDTDKPKWDVYNKQVNQLKSSGFNEGVGGNGYTSKVLTDPNGKKHVFVKRVEPTPGPGPQPPGEDPWKKFNEKERSLLNSGYKKGYGSDGDEEKSLTDPNGEVHAYYKKRPVEAVTILASFRKTAQNTVQWSVDLKNNAEKITIVFNNGIKTFTEDVTGMSAYKFESGDKDFDGVECTVTLKVILKPNVKMKDVPKLTMITHC